MIYCVVPEELADELYDKLAAYYADDDNVKVIIDRRQRRATRPRRRARPRGGQQREMRDRRRPRVPGDFPPARGAGILIA